MAKTKSVIFYTILFVGIIRASGFYQQNSSIPHLLWPFPASYSFGNIDVVIDDPCHFAFNINNLGPEKDIPVVFEAYKGYMFSDAKCFAENNSTKRNNVLNFEVKDINKIQIDLDVDESYSLKVEDENFVISAETYVGALRGLETFSQLISQKQDGTYFISSTPIQISDAPRFSHRGLMLDTSRHFISKTNILKILDGMMFSKLNVFHWHLADSDSFPFFFPSHPNLTKFGSFSSKQVYSKQDIQEIIDYAYVRGVRIIPELDSPAHVRSWSQAPQATNLINCTTDGPFSNRTLGTPLGQINPILNETYDFLKDLFKDLDIYFPWEFVHLGSDEMDPYCWNNTDIYNFMIQNHIKDFGGLFNYYVNRERGVVNQTKTRVYWLNSDTAAYLEFLPQEILQWWGYTLDLYSQLASGFGDPFGNSFVWDPMHTWLDIYSFQVDASIEGQILGLEACMWSEMVNDAVVIGRIFPRAASLGEKAWSQASNNQADNLSVFQRLNAWASRNTKRGILSGPVSTGFCEINPSKCFSEESPRDSF